MPNCKSHCMTDSFLNYRNWPESIHFDCEDDSKRQSLLVTFLFNPPTFQRRWLPPPSEVFLSFSLDNTKKHLTFSGAVCLSLARILRQNQWCSVAMVTRYDVISSWWSSHFWVKMHVLSTSFNNNRGVFACACVYPLNDNSVGALNLMAGNRKLA